MTFFTSEEIADKETFAYALDGGNSQKLKDLEALRKAREEKKLRFFKRRKRYAKSRTNHLARMHNLPEPNNPEALKADRKNCYKCSRRLDSPNAYKKLPIDVQKVLGEDEDIRTICCFCFDGVQMDKEIVQTRLSDKKIRLLVYDPVEAVKLGYDLIQRIKRKIRSYPQCVLVGTFKHDDLDDELAMENLFLSRFPTRWG